MNWYSLFYKITIADSLKHFFDVFSTITTVTTVFSCIVLIIISVANIEARNKKDQSNIISSGFWLKMIRNFFYFSFTFMVFFWIGYILTPTKKDCIMIIAAGSTMNYLSNDSVAKAIPKEILNFVTIEIKNLASDAKINLLQDEAKNKILEQAKSLTNEQLIQKIKTDSVFAKTVLSQ